MSSTIHTTCLEIAQIAKDIGILDEIPESDEALVLLIDELLQHIGVVR